MAAPPTPPGAQTLCAHCAHPAILKCMRCKLAPTLANNNNTPLVVYCNQTCQAAHWATHKATCHRLRDRMILYRVADTAQKLFYIAREMGWIAFEIEGVKKEGREIMLQGKQRENVQWSRDYIEFPHALFPEEEDRRAVLTFLACREAVIWMNEFVVGFLGGIVTRTELITHRVQNERRNVRLIPLHGGTHRFGNAVSHEVLKITLVSGEVFAVDLAGAQYGYSQPVELWSTYAQTRILHLESSTSPPPSCSILHTSDYSFQKQIFFCQKMSEPKEPHRVAALDLLEAMNGSMLEWQMDGKLSLKKLWKLPKNEFALKQANLVDYLDFKLNNTDPRVRLRYFTVRGRAMDLRIKKRGGKFDFKAGGGN